MRARDTIHLIFDGILDSEGRFWICEAGPGMTSDRTIFDKYSKEPPYLQQLYADLRKTLAPKAKLIMLAPHRGVGPYIADKEVDALICVNEDLSHNLSHISTARGRLAAQQQRQKFEADYSALVDALAQLQSDEVAFCLYPNTPWVSADPGSTIVNAAGLLQAFFNDKAVCLHFLEAYQPPSVLLTPLTLHARAELIAEIKTKFDKETYVLIKPARGTCGQGIEVVAVKHLIAALEAGISPIKYLGLNDMFGDDFIAQKIIRSASVSGFGYARSIRLNVEFNPCDSSFKIGGGSYEYAAKPFSDAAPSSASLVSSEVDCPAADELEHLVDQDTLRKIAAQLSDLPNILQRVASMEDFLKPSAQAKPSSNTRNYIEAKLQALQAAEKNFDKRPFFQVSFPNSGMQRQPIILSPWDDFLSQLAEILELPSIVAGSSCLRPGRR